MDSPTHLLCAWTLAGCLGLAFLGMWISLHVKRENNKSVERLTVVTILAWLSDDIVIMGLMAWIMTITALVSGPVFFIIAIVLTIKSHILNIQRHE